jgi:DNA-binding response OmpR family regulator
MPLQRAAASTGALSGRRILVIEDEYFLAEDIARALKALGARVVGPIGELDEATHIVESDVAIDAAVLDINLRSEMVFSLARLLRDRSVPFVFTSGYDKTSIETEFRDITLWEKPLDFAAMALDLADLLAPPTEAR